jgi:carboxylate-amine ligase
VIHSLVVWLGAQHDAGERLAPAPRWQIEENRWSACRYGVQGKMADPHTGRPEPTASRLLGMLELLGEYARRVGAQRGLERALAMVEVNGAIAQRRAAGAGGARSATEWLADRFLK